MDTNPKPDDNGTMFGTSKSELSEMLISTGQLTIGEDFLKIENYPFEPSIAYSQTIFKTNQIDDIDFTSSPPTFRVGNELIFLRSDKKAELEEFAVKNNIETAKRPAIWSWILEPFLDTEFTTASNQRVTKLLENCGLTSERVNFLRAEVQTQMLKYNFDTMLLEWFSFSASDVLRAMRTKYKKDEFEDFYRRVMKIALLTPRTIE
jgi:hypothetical protein